MCILLVKTDFPLTLSLSSSGTTLFRSAAAAIAKCRRLRRRQRWRQVAGQFLWVH